MFEKTSGGGEKAKLSTIAPNNTEIHMFDSCSFEENFASLGGALCFSTDNLEVNFGPGCVFTHNGASQMGGVLYIEESTGSRGVRSLQRLHLEWY